LDGQIWALKADSLTSPLIVTVTVTVFIFHPSRTENSVFQTVISVPRDGK